MSEPKFVPKTVYVTYIAQHAREGMGGAHPRRIHPQYFFGHSVEIEPKTGGNFIMRAPDGSVHMRGRVVEYDPPRRLAITWASSGMEEFRELPEFARDLRHRADRRQRQAHDDGGPPVGCPRRHPRRRPSGLAVHPVSLKSVLETGKPIEVSVKMGPPRRCWRRSSRRAKKPWVKSAEKREPWMGPSHVSRASMASGNETRA